ARLRDAEVADIRRIVALDVVGHDGNQHRTVFIYRRRVGLRLRRVVDTGNRHVVRRTAGRRVGEGRDHKIREPLSFRMFGQIHDGAWIRSRYGGDEDSRAAGGDAFTRRAVHGILRDGADVRRLPAGL